MYSGGIVTKISMSHDNSRETPQNEIDWAFCSNFKTHHFLFGSVSISSMMADAI